MQNPIGQYSCLETLSSYGVSRLDHSKKLSECGVETNLEEYNFAEPALNADRVVAPVTSTSRALSSLRVKALVSSHHEYEVMTVKESPFASIASFSHFDETEVQSLLQEDDIES